MAQQAISLPGVRAGFRVGLGQYVAGVAKAKANPEAQFKHGLENWWPCSGAEIVGQFRRGVHDRINRHVPGHGVGRKWDRAWQLETQRCARKVNEKRLVVRPGDVPSWLRAKMAHRIEEYGEW